MNMEIVCRCKTIFTYLAVICKRHCVVVSINAFVGSVVCDNKGVELIPSLFLSLSLSLPLSISPSLFFSLSLQLVCDA